MVNILWLPATEKAIQLKADDQDAEQKKAK
jgi:hypothetical protein